jgi:hypothetical protein
VSESRSFRCHLASAPGHWATYEGHVDVIAPSDATASELFELAVRRLSRTSFRDRPSLSSWRLVAIDDDRREQ